MRRCAFVLQLVAALCLSTGEVGGQQLIYNALLIVPIIAETPSYASTIYVHNPWINATTISFNYQGATTSVTPGTKTCASIEVGAGSVFQTSLGALCPGLNAGSNFGVLLTDYGSGLPIAVYTRVETPSGNGFSIEGMVDTCCGVVKDVIGLKRQAAFPVYQSNCFIYNEEARPGRVVVTLATGAGQLIGSKIVDLAANEAIRMLDVFSSLDAAPGDYLNARASFESIAPVGGGQTVNFIASCTVQNNTSFDADFRVAKLHY